MIARYISLFMAALILSLSVFTVRAQSEPQAADLIQAAIREAGGMDTWHQNRTLVVHEDQTRYEDEGTVHVSLVHFMDTMGNTYRLELSRAGKDYVYGWDGKSFWATVDGRAGDHDLVREARRVISDAYFRFSLPFILGNTHEKPEYTGKQTDGGVTTRVVRLEYSKGAADRYFAAADTEHGHNAAAAETEHGAAGHGHGGEVYNFHFNGANRLVKVHFSHHGDGTYETLLLDDFGVVDGITREYKRTLLRADGATHYTSEFTDIKFVTGVDAGLFAKP